MITKGCKVIRKPECRTYMWFNWCKQYNLPLDYKFTVQHYEKDREVLTLKEGVGAFEASHFLVCTGESEQSSLQQPALPQPKSAPVYDMVKQPKHYAFFDEVESIQVIASSMTKEEFRGFCFGNRLKYRMRAGKKDNIEQELSKSDFYIELFNRHKDLCRTSSLFGA